jgi:hypothetical protein
MRKLTPGAKAVLVGVAFLLTFVLGLVLGATVQEGIYNTLAAVGR